MSMKRTWVKSVLGTGIAVLGSLWFGLQLAKDSGVIGTSSKSEYTLSVSTQQL